MVKEEYYKLTEALDKQLHTYIAEGKRDLVKTIIEMLDHYIGVYKNLLENYPPQDIANSFYELLDKEVQKYKLPQFASCRKACSFCCRIAVNVSKEEAYLIRNQYAEIVEERLEILTKQSQCKTHEDWNKLPYKDRACAFLGDDFTCRIYEYRPISCRKYYVASKPELCDSDSSIEKINIVIGDTVEVIASAILNVSETRLLPEMILKAEIHKED